MLRLVIAALILAFSSYGIVSSYWETHTLSPSWVGVMVAAVGVVLRLDKTEKNDRNE